MAFNGPAIKVVIRGTLRGTESWSIGLWVIPTTPFATLPDFSTYALLSLAPAIDTNLLPTLQTVLAASDAVTQYDFYYYSVTSATLTYKVSKPFTPAVGAGAATNPTQLAQVLSLRSTLDTRSGRGRVYVPVTGVAAVAGQIPTATNTALVTKLVALIRAWGTLSNTAVTVVASATHSFVNTVISVQADTKFETQRRREDKIPPTATASVSV